jgi:hypothetical protein
VHHRDLLLQRHLREERSGRSAGDSDGPSADRAGVAEPGCGGSDHSERIKDYGGDSNTDTALDLHGDSSRPMTTTARLRDLVATAT